MSTVKEALAEAKRIREQFNDLGAEERSAVVRDAEWQIRHVRSTAAEAKLYEGMNVEQRSQFETRELAQFQTDLDRHQDVEFRSLLQGYIPAGLVERSGPSLAGSEQRDLGVATGAGGGFTTPQSFSEHLAKSEAFFSAMTQASPPVNVASGTLMPQASIDDTSGTQATILVENTAPTEVDVTVGSRNWSAFDYVSPLVRWSVQLAQDSGVWDDGNLEQQIAWLCGQRLGRIQNTHYTTGTGTTLPMGLFTSQAVAAGVAVGATSAAPTVVALADLVALFGSLDEAYHANAKFMISPATRTALRALVGTDGLPIFPPHLPLQLFGHEVVVNPAIVTVAATTFSAAYGDFPRGYRIRSVGDPAFRVLRERAMDQLSLEGFAFVRRDGQPSDVKAIKLLQQHV
jgi:HK97 family phage major capsid protein